MRCVSCNGVIDVLVDHPEIENQTDEMCSTCRSLAYSEWSYVDDHEHLFDNLREGITPIMICDN